VPALGGHLGGPHLGVPIASLIIRAVQVDSLLEASVAGLLLQVVWVNLALALGVHLFNFCHLVVDEDGNRLHAFHLFPVLRPPMVYSSCFFLAAVATATAPATLTSHVLFRRIQREGLMLNGLLTAGRFVPAAGPSQAAAVTWHAPKGLLPEIELVVALVALAYSPLLCWR
jgi:hypothetical protein